MSGRGILLAAALAVPLAMLMACVSRAARERLPSLLVVAPVPALAAALLAYDGAFFALPHTPLRLTLELDLPAAILLGAVAMLWIAAGAYAPSYNKAKTDRASFVVWWLLTLIGNIGVFIAADLVSFYLVFALVSLAAYGMIVLDGTPGARRAGFVYVALGVLGEACLLLGFVQLAAGTGGDSLLIRDVVAALPSSPWRDTTLMLLLFGFGLKIGLVPLHVWIPLAHSASPLPVSVVLSGAVVKAGLIGLIRFVPSAVALPEWGMALTIAGVTTAYYGVVVGVTQDNPKAVLAYSTMSQMGVIAAVLGLALSVGDGSAALGAGVYAFHHVLAKGALFLAVGMAAATARPRLGPVLFVTALLGLSLGGMPFTGGAIAKLAVKAQLGDGIASALVTLSAAGTTLLMLHFIHRLEPTAAQAAGARPPAVLVATWAGTAAAALVGPWVLFHGTGLGAVSEALSPAALWDALWPVGVGAGLALLRRRWSSAIPRVPEGDIAVFGTGAARLGQRCGDAIEVMEGRLRQFSAAGVTLLAFTLALGVVFFLGR